MKAEVYIALHRCICSRGYDSLGVLRECLTLSWWELAFYNLLSKQSPSKLLSLKSFGKQVTDIMEYDGPSVLNIWYLFPTVLETGKSKEKMLPSCVEEGSLPGLQMAIFLFIHTEKGRRGIMRGGGEI